MTTLGIENFLKDKSIKTGKFALLAHLASVDRKYSYTWDLLYENNKENFIKMFSPQHGIMGTEQANMIETSHSSKGYLDLPIVSLYSEERKPKAKDLEDIDTLIIDMQDVGARYYTYIYTMALSMQAAAESGVKVIVLDRPNPLPANKAYGNLNNLFSFVGLYEIPVQHGLTIGEIALLFNSEFNIGCDLQVIKMSDYDRTSSVYDGHFNWVVPSPNMPYQDTVFVYPGGCLLEGTNFSEGRGTTRPFEIIGAPYIEDEEKYSKILNDEKLPGVHFRPIKFRPTFDKFSGEVCNGAFVHVTDRDKFNAYLTYVAILKHTFHLCPDSFAWNPPPYEYEYKELPIDILLGDKKVRGMIEENAPMSTIDEFCRESIKPFLEKREKYIIY